MNHRKGLVWALFLLLQVTACGDDDDGGDEGTSGAGGTSSGAGRGSSTPTAGNGNSTGNSAGSSGTGNPSANAGSGGRGSFGGRGGGFNQQMCPDAEPASGGTCTPGRGDCEFGTRVCDCLNDSMTWSCWDPADCPATAPAADSACDTIGMECEYDGDDCECEDTGWDCEGGFGGGGRNGGDLDAGI